MRFALTILCVLLLGCAGRTKTPATAKAKPSGSPKTLAPISLKILTYNIHHGEGVDGVLDLKRIASVIKNSGADLVALQEVDRNAKRTGGVDQAQRLGELTGMHPAYGAAMSFQGGYYGQAILSRFPIEGSTVYQLPQRAGREPRIALAVKTRQLLFVSTHLDHELEEIRMQQATKLRSILSTNTVPTILAGDFNASPTNQTMQIFAEWSDTAGPNPAPTIPSEKPRRKIDYILLSPNSKWKTLESKVLEEPVASDHRPVFAEIR